MSLRFIDSFDHYQTADITKKWTAISAYGGGVIEAGGRNGNCLHMANGGFASLTLDAQSTWVIGFAYKTSTSERKPITDVLDVGDLQVTLRLNADNTLSVVRGSHTTGTELGKSVSALSNDTWYYIELKITIGNSGSYQVKVNNVNWIASAVGDTQATANATANRVRLYCATGVSGNYYDDLYVCDGQGTYNKNFLGDCRVQAIFPDANGANNDFTGSDSDSTDNYALVQEKATDFPDDDATYVQSLTVGHKDTYLFEDVAYAEGETAIAGIQVLVCDKKTAAGPMTICPVVRVGAADYDGVAVAPSEGSYSYMRQVYGCTPDANADQWTPDNLAVAEIGHKIVSVT